jgi:hypothetical protein
LLFDSSNSSNWIHFRCSAFPQSWTLHEANQNDAALSKSVALLPTTLNGPRSCGPKVLGGREMKKVYLITAVLLLSTAWVVAQTAPTSPSTSQTSPSTQQSTPPSQSVPDASSQTAQTSTDNSSIEGCLNGSAGSWTLTDSTGKTWQLAGDTSKLSDHVGHQVRISGSEGSASASPSSGAAGGAAPSASSGAGASSGSQPTFNVKKVKMISSSCPTPSK